MSLQPHEKTAPNWHARAAKHLLDDAYVVDAGRAEYKLRQAQVEATLAVAYEQQTANLLALLGMSRDGELTIRLMNEVGERLATGIPSPDED
jgi:hypothetical protein